MSFVTNADLKEFIDWTEMFNPNYLLELTAELYVITDLDPGGEYGPEKRIQYVYQGRLYYYKPRQVFEKTGVRIVPGDLAGNLSQAQPAYGYSNRPNVDVSIFAAGPVSVELVYHGWPFNGSSVHSTSVNRNTNNIVGYNMQMDFNEGGSSYHLILSKDAVVNSFKFIHT
jgi:hypothetical protein